MSDPVATPAAAQAPDFAAFEARENAVAAGETPPAEPTPAPEPEPEPDPDEAPEPEPAAEAAPVVPERKISKRQEHLNNLERRAAEAESARAELAARLAAVEARTKPAEEPAKPEAVVDPKDPEPQEADFETYGQFTRAVAQWAIRQDRREAEAAAAKTKAAETEAAQRDSDRTRIGGWVGRRDAFMAKHPEKAAAVTAFLGTVTSGTPIGDTIIESEVGGELADYLATHPDEAERIARLAPLSALRALGKLEALFDSTSNASAPAQPAAKTVTTAPAIPHTLAARSADPADPVRAAVERGDYSAFEAEMNRALA